MVYLGQAKWNELSFPTIYVTVKKIVGKSSNFDVSFIFAHPKLKKNKTEYPETNIKKLDKTFFITMKHMLDDAIAVG